MFVPHVIKFPLANQDMSHPQECEIPVTLNFKLGIMFRRIAPKHNVFAFLTQWSHPLSLKNVQAWMNQDMKQRKPDFNLQTALASKGFFECIWKAKLTKRLWPQFSNFVLIVKHFYFYVISGSVLGVQLLRKRDERRGGGEDRRSWLTCGASALELMLSAVQLSSFSLQLLLLPQQVGLSCSSSRLNQESHKHFSQQTQ